MSNILFISPNFYNYEKRIIRKLNDMGNVVYSYNEVPFGVFYYILNNINVKLAEQLVSVREKYILWKLKRIHVDKVFIIRGFSLTLSFMLKLKELDVPIIFYQWDSIKNNPNAKLISKYANDNYSFDPVDAKVCNFQYLPLYYDWNKSDISTVKKRNDILLVGTWSNERFNVYIELVKMCKKSQIRLCCYLFMPIQSYVRRFLKGEKIPYSLIKFRSLSRKKYLRMLLSSAVLLDIPSPSQSGCTMRTIEALSLKRKLITTNKFIKNEDFYNERNVLIYPCESEEIVSFLKTDYDCLSSGCLLSLEQWLEKLGFICK